MLGICAARSARVRWFSNTPAPPLYRACENQESGTDAATLKGNNHAARIYPPGGRPPPIRDALWKSCSSKKGVSALQIKRETGLTYKSALFMMHRIQFR